MTPGSSVVLQQSATPATGTEQGNTPERDIIVTGTHIARPELQSTMPISVLHAEDAQNFARDTVYDSLLLDPAIGPGLGEFNSGGQEYDQGVANINLRNLGANRSLVLVDGQRWVSGGARTSAVDLNTIPSSLIDRYEVVTGGASAIYGADAVTGAVNIIMKNEVHGVHLSTTNGLSEQGDAAQHYVSLATGTSFAGGRGHLVFGADYTSTDPITDAERGLDNNRYVYEPNNANNLVAGIPKNTGPNDGIPDNVLVSYKQFYRSDYPTFCLYKTASTCGSNNGQWYQLVNNQVISIPQSSYTVYSAGDTGIQSDNGTGGIPSTASDIYAQLLLRSYSVKASSMLRASFELTPAITWNGFFSYGHSYTRANPEWPQVRDDSRPTNWYGGTTGEIARLTDPFIPKALYDFMVANKLTSIPLDRQYINLPQAWETHDRNNISFGTDLGGHLIDKLKWGAFARFGQVIDDIVTTNMVGKNEWLKARNAIVDPATGQIVCADPAARAGGCVPFNYYTTDASSQAFDNYALFNRYERTMNSLLNTGIHADGSVVRLPYGDLSIAVGAEWRQETLHTQDDADAAKLADIIYAPGEDYHLHPALYHRRQTAEAYAEVVVPVLSDLPFAKRLEIEGAYRFSHYSDNPNTHTWKAGGSWEPVAGLSLRGTYSHAVRVPNFGELFSPVSVVTLGHISDPCQADFITQNVNRAANCAATIPGVKLPLFNPDNNAPQVISGGNPALTPETSNSLTVGAVIAPKFLRGFDLTVDYWRINISNVITSLAYTTILNDCVDSAGGPSTAYCQLVHRFPAGTGYLPGFTAANDPNNAYLLDGNVNYIQAQYANLAGQLARGIDVAATYRTPIGKGRLLVRFSGTYTLDQIVTAEVGKAGTNYAGAWNYPRFRGTLMTSYSLGPVTLGVNTRLISTSKYSVTAASDETYQFPRIPAYVYNDLTLNLRANDRFTFSLGARNITGTLTPLQLQNNAISPGQSNGSITGTGGAAYYDAIGRYLFAKINVNL